MALDLRGSDCKAMGKSVVVQLIVAMGQVQLACKKRQARQRVFITAEPMSVDRTDLDPTADPGPIWRQFNTPFIWVNAQEVGHLPPFPRDPNGGMGWIRLGEQRRLTHRRTSLPSSLAAALHEAASVFDECDCLSYNVPYRCHFGSPLPRPCVVARPFPLLHCNHRRLALPDSKILEFAVRLIGP